MNTDLYDQIINTPVPAAINSQLRREPRKAIAAEIRKLLKSLNIKGVSVRTPNYSMASGVDISLPGTSLFVSEDDHLALHHTIDIEHRADLHWCGLVQYCPHCQKSKQAKDALENIILGAFPDLDNRSDTQSDYFDYILSIN